MHVSSGHQLISNHVVLLRWTAALGDNLAGAKSGDSAPVSSGHHLILNHVILLQCD